jgi:peptidoglycan/xylan/chitin deacetylase (PgdA/CDA1 family)
MKGWSRRAAWCILAAAATIGLVAIPSSCTSSTQPTAARNPTLLAVRPLANDCRSGSVAFTFDDGPGPNTPLVLEVLARLHLSATFFVLGDKIAGNPAGQRVIRDEAAHGFQVGNHTYDHASFTGASTGKPPLTAAQITSELNQASAAIVAAGLPAPTLYRPPYGDVDAFGDAVSRGLGYRIVMPFSAPGGNIVDSRDWTGVSPAQIVTFVTTGGLDTNTGRILPGIARDSIIGMHDGETTTTMNMLAALQPIVDYMNAHGFCSTGTIRPDATGGLVPLPAPALPVKGNLVTNPDLTSSGLDGVPRCFARAGSAVAGNLAAWSSSHGPGGSSPQTVTVTRWKSGDRKLVIDQSATRPACAMAVRPGQTLQFWIGYTGMWPRGASGTRVAMVTYYRTGSGGHASPYVWHYWQTGPLVSTAVASTTAYFTTSALPSGANGASVGLTIKGNGTLTVSRFTAVAAN